MLSNIARTFDTLGLLVSVLTKAEIVPQRLQIKWDETLPNAEHGNWLQFQESLRDIDKVSASRYILTNNLVQIKICGYADASEKAYGVTLYVVSSNSTSEQTSQSKLRIFVSCILHAILNRNHIEVSFIIIYNFRSIPKYLCKKYSTSKQTKRNILNNI